MLEAAYDKIRSEERGLDLERLDPPEPIERLIDSPGIFLRNRSSSRCSARNLPRRGT